MQSVGPRLVHAIRWDTLYSIGGQVQDTTVLRARLIAAREGHLYAYDFGDARLKAFDRTGGLHWSFGRSGAGPGEFTNPTHLAVAGNGDVWVTDAGAGRVTVVGRDGSLREHIPFGDRPVLRALPLPTGALLIPTTPDQLWLRIDESGEVADQAIPPTPELRAANPSMRASFIDVAPDGNTWALAFIVANPFLVYQGSRLRCVGELIEGTPQFPEGEVYRRDMPVWAIAIALSDTSLFVLARGQTEYEREILDEYSLRDCTYRRTLRLPRKLQGMAHDGEIFYFYHETPIPTILALRPGA